MPGRDYNAGTQYRYGFNGQEKSNEIKGDANSYTAEFWEYDPRLGRRWNVDPKPNISLSPYNCFGNNPVRYVDALGDTLRGINETSATRQKDVINSHFTGDKYKDLRDLFQISHDKVTFESINSKAFLSTIAGLSSDDQIMAAGYFFAINGEQVHEVEVLFRSEPTSAKAQADISVYRPLALQSKTGDDLDPAVGGGYNTATSTGTYTAYLLDSKRIMTDLTGTKIERQSGGELSAHELLGHGLGWVFGSPSWDSEDAIQMGNMHRRKTGHTTYRDGGGHFMHTLLTAEVANGTPEFLRNKLVNLIMGNVFDKFIKR